MNMRQAVSVVGTGRVQSLAASAKAHSACAQQTLSGAIVDVAALPELLSRYYGQQSPPSLRRVPHYARIGLLGALRAMETAGWNKDTERDTTTALIIGSAYCGAQMSMDFMDSLLDQGPRLSSPTAFSHAVNNMGAGLLSLLLGLRGPCHTVSQFELSFAGALQLAAITLHAGRAQRVILGALDEMDPRFVHCCAQADKPELLPLPPQEGAAFFCLQRPESAGEKPLLLISWQADTGTHAANNDRADMPRRAVSSSSLAHAFEVTKVLTNAPAEQRLCCPCVDAAHGRQASITVQGGKQA